MSFPADTLTIAIFSFNRGAYLRNVLDSIERHASSCVVKVYDDRSTDPDTIAVLQECQEHVVVSQSPSSGRHGNLYRNMQCALDDCDTRFLLFLQDDTQIIRDLTESDFDDFQKVFAGSDIGFARPHFLKAGDCGRFRASTGYDAERRGFFPLAAKGKVEFGNAFCDVCIADVPKLRAVKWRFSEGEWVNQTQAREAFAGMPFLASPFMFYCPEVPSYRDRKLYLASRIVQRRRQGRVVAFRPLTGEALRRFLDRDPTVLPVAEDFLEPTEPDVMRPFVYQDFLRSPWLLALYKVESRLYRIWRGLVRWVRPRR